jgi:hypothetical protein
LGRGNQVREVITRLGQTRFVAVVGGSGSGKSSLIRAGVVPKLRGYGIPEAGAYWIPVICTPGTTPYVALETSGAVAQQKGHDQTPINRLAWKLSQALRPLNSPQEEAERRTEIATVFRQGAGFARLVDAYHDELPQRGPDGKEARFLFVIDQFEELFHPNNHGSGDAQKMIEAVIDHFFNPHDRCFVIMTMRSEHLSDCAAYLELPDAINKSLYLVRRLNENELRDAIVGPAKYYLRLLQRGNDGLETTLPPDVIFDERVIARLLNDVASIAGNADHLPLLQHVLARTWGAACLRENLLACGVPGHVCWVDLEHAVAPGAGQAGGSLRDDDSINTLRISLENWGEFTYRQHSEDERIQIDAVLRHLAFKDPNNGLYFQQRVDVDDPGLLPGFPKPREQLRKLLDRGFLDTVNYFFWDEENPDRVTLKVSHEAFIRGWEHFRKLIDIEADRFDEFVAVLRKCALWQIDHLPRFLLEASELERIKDADLNTVFEARDERKDWFRVLLQYRDGERLSKIESEVDQFLAASRARVAAIEHDKHEMVERERLAVEAARETQRQQETERREHEAQRKQDEADRLRLQAETERARAETTAAKAEGARARADAERAKAESERAVALKKRNRWMALSAIGAALVISLYAGFAGVIQGPAMERMNKFTNARSIAESRGSDPNPVPGESLLALRALVKAATLVEDAKRGKQFRHWSADKILDGLDFLPQVALVKTQLANSSSEPAVNGRLRRLLTRMVWSSKTDPTKVTHEFRAQRTELSCLITGKKGPAPLGSLFQGLEAGRGIFVPKLDSESEDEELKFYNATLQKGECFAGQVIWSAPRYLNPAILFDAQLTRFAVALGPSGEGYVNLFSLVWEQDNDSPAIGAKPDFLSVVPDPPSNNTSPSAGARAPANGKAVDLMRREFQGERSPKKSVQQVKVVKSWPAVGGIEVSVSGRAWRVFSDMAQPIPSVGDKTDYWSELEKAKDDSVCAHLGQALQTKDGENRSMFHAKGLCIAVQRSRSAPAPTRGSDQPKETHGITGARERLLVAIYAEPPRQQSVDSLKENLPTSITGFVFGTLLSPGSDRWLIGKADKPYEGWIALEQRPDAQLLGTPWSTTALKKLGQEVLEASATVESRQTAPPTTVGSKSRLLALPR